jgi:hypothetical protein
VLLLQGDLAQERAEANLAGHEDGELRLEPWNRIPLDGSATSLRGGPLGLEPRHDTRNRHVVGS